MGVGVGGGLTEKHLTVETTVRKVSMCLFVFVKWKTRKDGKNTFYIWIFTSKNGYYNGKKNLKRVLSLLGRVG